MADQADDHRVRDQLKVLTGLKLPGFNWKANNMRMEFDIFWQTLKFVLEGMEIPEEKWYLYILQQLGREGMEWWTTSIEATVNKADPLAIINAFKKGYGLEETYWTYRSLYLSSEKQGRAESAAALTTRVEDLVSMCKWPDNQKEQRHIDLFYHLSEVFDVRRFVQIETSREGGNLTWEKLVEEAKHQEHVGKEYAKFRRENGGGGTPSYGNPALAADAISRGYNKPQQRSQTPSGGKGGKGQKQCDRCGRRNGCTGEKGTCPAWGKECGVCKGKNHYRAVCQKSTQMQAGGGAQPKFQKQGKGKSPGKNGKPKELPLCREKPIFHEPVGTLIKDKEQLTAMYPNSFDRIGSLKGEYTIKIDPSITPVQQARRKVPIESKEAICAALDSMIEGDILEPQIEPTPWVNSATYPVKPTGEVRPCLDCMPLNKAIIRENHTLPTVEEIAHELAGVRYFMKGDAYKAFLHVHLSKKSRELTVFGKNTHGRLWYKRMPFGMKMSQDVFQIQMHRILEQCPGVIGIHDDVIIYGYSWEDHDANLINFLNVCQMEGLCLSSKKLELRGDRVSFFGAIYSREGVEPDPRKIQGIEEMTAPETKQQLQSFLGMVTYMGNFIPHLSHHTELLRQLLKKDVTFYWDDQLTRSFQEIKHLLKRATSKLLGYYDRRKVVIVQADASLRGLGACLI